MADDTGGRRRSRRRATAHQGPPRPPAEPGAAATAPSPAEPARAEPARAEPARAEPARAEPTPRPRRENRTGPPAAKTARGDRDLVGSGSSQVGPTGAMRARDLNRPTAEDLAQAAADLDIVRRHWTPTIDQPGPRPRRRRS